MKDLPPQPTAPAAPVGVAVNGPPDQHFGEPSYAQHLVPEQPLDFDEDFFDGNIFKEPGKTRGGGEEDSVVAALTRRPKSANTISQTQEGIVSPSVS